MDEWDSAADSFYEITKFPFTEDKEYIGVLMRSQTLQKRMFDTLLDTSTAKDALEKLHYAVASLKEYYHAVYANIWLYDEEEGYVTPCLEREKVQEMLEAPLYRTVTKEQIEALKKQGDIVMQTNDLQMPMGMK